MTSTVVAEELNETEKLAKAATPGPYSVGINRDVRNGSGRIATVDGCYKPDRIHHDAHVEQLNTAKLFAHMQPERTLRFVQRIRELESALRFYAQVPVPDISSKFAQSAGEWGEGAATWEPLTDLGGRARHALQIGDQ